jgi:hypothetical protein
VVSGVRASAEKSALDAGYAAPGEVAEWLKALAC